MNNLLKGRKFRLWEFKITHNSLLLRSPNNGDYTDNIDVICTNVSFISVPTNLGEIDIADQDESDASFLKEKFGLESMGKKIVKIICNSGTHYIICSQIIIESNESDYMSSPFKAATAFSPFADRGIKRV